MSKSAVSKAKRNGNDKGKEDLLELTQEIEEQENTQTQEATSMDPKTALLEAIEEEVQEASYDFSEWTMEWVEKVGQNGYPYGYVDLKSPDCTVEKPEIRYGTDKQGPVPAMAAATAWSSLRQQDYLHIEPGLVVNGLNSEYGAHVASYHSGSVTINGKTIEVPVPEKPGFQILKGDTHFGFQVTEGGFTSFEWAREILRKGKDNMTKAELDISQTFWKIHAVMSFQEFSWIRIELRHKSIEYVRTVMNNADDAEGRRAAINNGLFKQREHEHQTRIASALYKGEEPRGYKGQPYTQYDVFLVALKNERQEMLARIADVVGDPVILDEKTVLTLGAKQICYVELRDNGTARLVSNKIITKEEDLLNAYQTASRLNRAIYVVE